MGGSATDQTVITVSADNTALLSGNLLTLSQQSMEGSLHWSVSTNATLAISTTHAFDGTHALLMTAVASATSRFTTGTSTNAMHTDIVAGKNHTVKVRVWSSVVRTIRGIANYYDASGTGLGNQTSLSFGSSTAGAWKAFTVDGFIPPANTAKIELLIQAGATLAGEQHWFDEIYFGYINQAPVVDPGADRAVEPGANVSVTGSATSAGGTITTYAWAVDGSYTGPAVSLSGANTTTVSFVAPSSVNGAVIPLNLTATDNNNLSSTATVIVTVYPTGFVYQRINGALTRASMKTKINGTLV